MCCLCNCKVWPLERWKCTWEREEAANILGSYILVYGNSLKLGARWVLKWGNCCLWWPGLLCAFPTSLTWGWGRSPGQKALQSLTVASSSLPARAAFHWALSRKTWVTCFFPTGINGKEPPLLCFYKRIWFSLLLKIPFGEVPHHRAIPPIIKLCNETLTEKANSHWVGTAGGRPAPLHRPSLDQATTTTEQSGPASPWPSGSSAKGAPQNLELFGFPSFLKRIPFCFI